MSAILPTIKLDSDPSLSKVFLPYQTHWILAEDSFHAQRKQAYAIVEKSIRIGWTFCDAFKNVRKRLRFKNRDYLFVTKDFPSALEYMTQVYKFAELFNLTGSVISRGEESMNVPRHDQNGSRGQFTEEIKIGVIKFDTGSRIIAFSAHPQAMAVYEGDVGLDEFAKHPSAPLLWETAQGRVAWGYDIAVWSSHNGEDTLFNEFVLEARAGKGLWNLYYRVTLPDAIDLGLVETINRTRGTRFTRQQFLDDCKARARTEEIFQQAYLCNPLGASANHIVEWSAIERCRLDYSIERLHLEAAQITQLFGQFSPARQLERQTAIELFIRDSFPILFSSSSGSNAPSSAASTLSGGSHVPSGPLRLGFDVAASGEGDLAAIYIDEASGDQLTLRALFTCRTEDWQFLKAVLFYFLAHLRNLSAAGDESGLGRQICWDAASHFPGRFLKVNFGSSKHDLGFALMNQLSAIQKRFPSSQPDIAADFFALRKSHTGTRWVFSEGNNTFNPVSHCDIAWAGALASYANIHQVEEPWAMVC